MKNKSLRCLDFKHPEPERVKNPVWPVFIPFAGCPCKCIYCSQTVQTGQTQLSPEQAAFDMRQGIIARYRSTGVPLSLGFFGGTFTALDHRDMAFLLKHAAELKEKGAVNHIRCSTRPDCISPETLSILKDYRLDMIELGIQSFSSSVLKASGRGYSSALAAEACIMVVEKGFELGIQLMPGLPGSDCSVFALDIRTTEKIQPAVVRIYPCLVLKNTLLAARMHKGLYKPWTLEKATAAVSSGLLRLWLRNIPVIRIGLTPEPALMDNILAGPWHPALGSLCRSTALKDYFLSKLEQICSTPEMICIPARHASDFWGYKKMNSRFFQDKGIEREMVRPWEKEIFRIYFS